MEQRLLLIQFLLTVTFLMCGGVTGDSTYQQSNKFNDIADGIIKIRKMDGGINRDVTVVYNAGPPMLKFALPSSMLRTTPFSYSVVRLGTEPMVSYNPMPPMQNMEYTNA